MSAGADFHSGPSGPFTVGACYVNVIVEQTLGEGCSTNVPTSQIVRGVFVFIAALQENAPGAEVLRRMQACPFACARDDLDLLTFTR